MVRNSFIANQQSFSAASGGQILYIDQMPWQMHLTYKPSLIRLVS